MLFPIAIALVCLVLLLGAAWLLGPRTPVDTRITFDPKAIGADLDDYLESSEAKVAGIQPNQHKDIVWADPSTKAKTPIAIVYIHGFSASPGEMRPLPDLIAAEMGANLYFTRLAGHGTTTRPMADASVNAWVNDFAEALAIGERLGDRVVIMGTSTGGALTTWALAQPAFRDRIEAVILCSPNFGVRAFGASLLTLPFAREISRLVLGETRSFEPQSHLQRLYWTTTYPVEAILPMAETVRLAVNAPVEQIGTPALFLISPDDAVVDPAITRGIAARWGGSWKLLEVQGVEDPSRHVLAGDAMSPATTEPVAAAASDWLRNVLSTAR
ncbi:MAG: alpha/beta fold hydrolase [Rhizobium sp.]|nr:alpha/beta fold hydrolase [Rhizobium sp.]